MSRNKHERVDADWPALIFVIAAAALLALAVAGVF
jgi:hypothetical protein